MGSPLTKSWIWVHYPIDPKTKHMQIFNVLKGLTLLVFLTSLPQEEKSQEGDKFQEPRYST